MQQIIIKITFITDRFRFDTINSFFKCLLMFIFFSEQLTKKKLDIFQILYENLIKRLETKSHSENIYFKNSKLNNYLYMCPKNLCLRTKKK